MRNGERGQILPGLLVIMLALLAVGVLMFQVGKAAVLRSSAQTAADAAALAGAREIRRQLIAQWASGGATDISMLDQALVRLRMAEYAKKNDATVIPSSVVVNGVDVKVAVTTDEELGDGAEDIDEEDAKGQAHARARIELLPSVGLGGSIGPLPGGGSGSGPVPKISEKDWKEIEEKLGGGAPDCDDMVTLGRFLQDQGFVVGENTAFGPVGEHAPGGYHYQCGGRGAVDVNYGGPGDLDPLEVRAVDPIIAPLRELGFRTIWRASGHYNHLHIDVANSGPIGAGSGGMLGGFTGPLEDVLMQVRLIDWDAPTAPFFGLGGAAGGGFFAGPPDPEAARAVCSVARRLGASDKVLLAAYEAAIVESGVHSLPYGDRDSIGMFQQRDSWGSFAQRMNPVWASEQFISRAIRQERSWMTAGQLAQDVQVSAFPDRYDQRQAQALSLIATYCSK